MIAIKNTIVKILKNGGLILTLVSFVIVVSFGVLLNTSIKANAQAPAAQSNAAEVNSIAAFGFTQCSLTTSLKEGPSSSQTAVNAQFQKCLQNIVQFFFIISLFLIAVRIGVEAFININPLGGGKAVDNSITLVRDITIGLLLIGAPGIFLSFFNPTTLSLNNILDLSKINAPKAGTNSTNGGNGANINPTGPDGKTTLDTYGYDKLTPETVADLINKKAGTTDELRQSTVQAFLSNIQNGNVDIRNLTPTQQKLIELVRQENRFNLIPTLESSPQFISIKDSIKAGDSANLAKLFYYPISLSNDNFTSQPDSASLLLPGKSGTIPTYNVKINCLSDGKFNNISTSYCTQNITITPSRDSVIKKQIDTPEKLQSLCVNEFKSLTSSKSPNQEVLSKITTDCNISFVSNSNL